MQNNNQHLVNIMNSPHLDKEYSFLDGHVIVMWLNQSGVLTRINQSLLDMTGYQESDLIGASYTLFIHPDFSDSVYTDVWNKVGVGKRWKGVVKILRKDGSYFWGLTTIMAIQYQHYQIRYLCAVRKPSRKQIILHREKYCFSNK
jgi:PAS domain S-box-containing protein